MSCRGSSRRSTRSSSPPASSTSARPASARALVHARARAPIVDTLKTLRMWVWDSDAVLPPQAQGDRPAHRADAARAAGRAYDGPHVDGFIAMPTAALAFQWSTQAHYLTDLRISFRSGCILIAAAPSTRCRRAAAVDEVGGGEAASAHRAIGRRRTRRCSGACWPSRGWRRSSRASDCGRSSSTRRCACGRARRSCRRRG